MNAQEYQLVKCPYCGETFEILLDCSIPQQDYIEDCYVCCRPINISVSIDILGAVNVNVTHENE